MADLSKSTELLEDYRKKVEELKKEAETLRKEHSTLKDKHGLCSLSLSVAKELFCCDFCVFVMTVFFVSFWFLVFWS